VTRVAVVAHGTKTAADGSDGLRPAVCDAVRAAGWPEPDWLCTTEEDSGRGRAQQAVKDGAELVMVCGGDGTVSSCAEGLAGTGVPMAVLGVGTGNLIAANLGIPTDLQSALKVLTCGVDRALDVGRYADGLVVGMAGIGLDAAMVTDAPAWLKKHVGWAAYVVSILRHLGDRGIRLTVELDGVRHVRRRVRTLVIGNMGTLRGGIQLLPDARADDGLLDAVLLAPRGIIGWLPVAARIATRRSKSTVTVERFQARHIVVRTAHSVPQEVDGEPRRSARVMDITIDPGALLVRIPRAVEQG
jgi:undecaprenyl-diphosphatase